METSPSGQSCQLALVRRCFLRNPQPTGDEVWATHQPAYAFTKRFLIQKALNDREVDGFQGSFLSRPPCWSQMKYCSGTGDQDCCCEYFVHLAVRILFHCNAIFSMLGWLKYTAQPFLKGLSKKKENKEKKVMQFSKNKILFG